MCGSMPPAAIVSSCGAQVLPVVRLRSLYNVESSLPDRTSVVVVNSPRGKYGIEVEVLLGQQQTVIKPLGRLFKTLRVFPAPAFWAAARWR
jgi:chemotaxis protein histidine kinase CheA